MGRKKNDKRKLCICNIMPEESFKSPSSMSSFHSVMHRSEVFQQDEAPEDTRQAGSAGVHFSPFSPRSYLLINTQNNCTCRSLSTANAPLEWNRVCAHCSLTYFSTLCTCRWMRRSLYWRLCMSCTDNHKVYHKYTVNLCDWNQLHNVQCKYLSTGWKFPLFFISLIHYESPASWQPKALLFPPQGLKSCHSRPGMSCVCVFARLLPAKAAQHRSSSNQSPVTAQSIHISGDNIWYWAACKSALLSVHCRLYLLSFLSPSSAALTCTISVIFWKAMEENVCLAYLGDGGAEVKSSTYSGLF